MVVKVGESAMIIRELGQVCDEWDFDHRRCAHSIAVQQIAGTSAAFFVTKLAVDADGAPRAYHPKDTGSFDYLANVSQSDLHGVQGQSGAVGPAPGFYISGTALSNPAFPEGDTRHWVDASTIPYFVSVGSGFPSADSPAPGLGCVAMVIDLNSGNASGAILADTGHAVGEGSIALAERLGLNPISKRRPPKVVGFEDKRFLYIVFSDRVVAPPWPELTIQHEARAGFSSWGGARQVSALFPHCPPIHLVS